MENRGSASPLKEVALASLAAALAGPAGVLLLTRDLETIGLGILVSPFSIPAILMFVYVDHIRPSRWYRHLGFVFSEGVGLAGGLAAFWWETGREVSDGGGTMAGITGIALAVSALAAHIVLAAPALENPD